MTKKATDGNVMLPYDLESPQNGPAPVTDSTTNGESQQTPKKPSVRQSWSKPTQAITRIEGLMVELTPKQAAIVFAWFVATYCPENSSMSVSTEPKP